MKNLVLIFASVFVLANCQEPLPIRYINSELAQTIQKTASKYCPSAGEKLKKALEDTEKCAESTFDPTTQTMCTTLQKHFRTCFNPLKTAYEECLPKESKAIPEYFVKGVMNYVNKSCNSNGELIFELSNHCITKNINESPCFKSTQEDLEQYEHTFPSNTELCKFVGKFRTCLKNTLTENCKHPVTKQAYLEFYDAATSPCRSQKIL